ncbi:MAG: hypothetical protein Q9220_004685 [cf. Caloplaca sp. 1 TL-2023]
MEDVDSFTIINPPAPEHESSKHSHTPFADYEQHSTSTRKATVVVLSNTLRRRYPDHALSIVTTSTCNIQGFCNAGKATLDAWKPQVALRTYQAPSTQLDGQEGIVLHQTVFDECAITYQNRQFIVYIAECLKEGAFFPLQVHNFILYRPQQPDEPSELASAVIDLLILEASKWTLELHQEIWIFDQLSWSKSHELWQSAQDADWDDVILDEEMKTSVRDDVEGFFREREEYKRFAIPWKRGIIFHGPPGNGKTISIRAIMKTLASLSVASLYVKSFTTFNPEYGIRRVFQKARATAPCLLIFEDVDSLVTPQTRSYFLNEVDGLEKNEGVLMLGSTNHLELLDPGISRRPSRFDRKYLFPLPSTEQRTSYCGFWRRKIAGRNAEIEFPLRLCGRIAGITEGFSFAYLKEAFVATLLTLLVRRKEVVGRIGGATEMGGVGGGAVILDEDRDGDGDDGIETLPLWKEMVKQVELLREELGDEGVTKTNND